MIKRGLDPMSFFQNLILFRDISRQAREVDIRHLRVSRYGLFLAYFVTDIINIVVSVNGIHMLEG